jgi:hypothetical protein
MDEEVWEMADKNLKDLFLSSVEAFDSAVSSGLPYSKETAQWNESAYKLFSKIRGLNADTPYTLNGTARPNAAAVSGSDFIKSLEEINPSAISALDSNGKSIIHYLTERAVERNTRANNALKDQNPNEYDLNDHQFKLFLFNKFCSLMIPPANFTDFSIGSPFTESGQYLLGQSPSSLEQKLACIAGGDAKKVETINAIAQEILKGYETQTESLTGFLSGGNHIRNMLGGYDTEPDQSNENLKLISYKKKHLGFQITDQNRTVPLNPLKRYSGGGVLKTTAAIVTIGTALVLAPTVVPWIGTMGSVAANAAATLFTGHSLHPVGQFLSGMALQLATGFGLFKLFDYQYKHDPHNRSKRISDRRFWNFGANKLAAVATFGASALAAVLVGKLFVGISLPIAIFAGIFAAQIPWRKYIERFQEIRQPQKLKDLESEIYQKGFEMEKHSDVLMYEFGGSNQIVRSMFGNEPEQWKIDGVLEVLDHAGVLSYRHQDTLINLDAPDLKQEIFEKLRYIDPHAAEVLINKAETFVNNRGIPRSHCDFEMLVAKHLNTHLLANSNNSKEKTFKRISDLCLDPEFNEIFTTKGFYAALAVPQELKKEIYGDLSNPDLRAKKLNNPDLRENKLNMQNVFYHITNEYLLQFYGYYAKQNSAMVNAIADPDEYLVALHQMDLNRPGAMARLVTFFQGNQHAPTYDVGKMTFIPAIFAALKTLQTSELIETGGDIDKDFLAKAEQRHNRNEAAKWMPISEGIASPFGMKAQNHTMAIGYHRHILWRSFQQFKDLLVNDQAFQDLTETLPVAGNLIDSIAKSTKIILPQMANLIKDAKISPGTKSKFQYVNIDTSEFDALYKSLRSYINKERYEALRIQLPDIEKRIRVEKQPFYNTDVWAYCGETNIQNLQDFTKFYQKRPTYFARSNLDPTLSSLADREIQSRNEEVVGFTKNGIVFKKANGQYDMTILDEKLKNDYKQQVASFESDVKTACAKIDTQIAGIVSRITRIQSQFDNVALALEQYKKKQTMISNDLSSANWLTRALTLQGETWNPLRFLMKGYSETSSNVNIGSNAGRNDIRTMNPQGSPRGIEEHLNLSTLGLQNVYGA